MPTLNKIHIGDSLSVLKTWPDGFVQTCVTSPPYWGLRDYGVIGQLGLEAMPDAYVKKMTELFREVRRVLRDDGTLWLNLGDSYAGSGKGAWDNKNGGQKEVYIPNSNSPQTDIPKIPCGLKAKDLVGIPWRVAFALQADGWYLRSDIIWSKPNPMPESVTDRPTKAHEYLFLMAKSERYYYDAAAIAEPAIYRDDTDRPFGENPDRRDSGKLYKDARSYDGKHSDKQRGHGRLHAGFNDRWDAMEKTDQCSGMRNKRTVWTVATSPFAEAHFATFPPDLIKPCVLAGCPEGGLVLDPFMGAGTTALVAATYNRNFIGIELNPAYAEIAEKRIANERAQIKMAI